MLVCKLEIRPEGDADRSYPVGEIRIAQTGGDCFIGDYTVELDKASRATRTPGIWRTADVTYFDHSELGAYDLLLRGLVACLGGRSHAAIAAISPAQVIFSHHPLSELEPA